MKLIKLRDYLIVLFVALVAFILGAIFDKQISQSMYQQFNHAKGGIIISNILLIFFLFMALTWAITMVVVCFKHKGGAVSIPVSILCVGGSGFFLYKVFDEFYSRRDMLGSSGLAIGLAIAVDVIALVLAIFSARCMIKYYDHEKIFRYCLAYLAIIAISLVIMVALKYLWSRPRPWLVYSGLNPDVYYTPVWELHPFQAFSSDVVKEFYKSFPSNHVATTLLVLPGLLFITKLDKRLDNDKTRVIMFYASILVGLLAALTRITAGAHFLSDVSFGLIISVTIYFMADLFMGYLNNTKHIFTFDNDK